MRQIWLVLLALTAGLLIFTASAQAQYGYYGFDENVARPEWNIHAGIGFFNGEAKNDTTGIVGIEHESPLSNEYLGQNSFFTLGADWYPVDTNSGDSESVVPLLIGYRKYGIFGGTNLYFGAAVGARWASGDIPELRIKDGFQFEWDVNVGVDITDAWFAQFRFLGGAHPSDDGLITIELAYRF